MKSTFKQYTAFMCAILMLIASGCSSVLDEEPRSTLTPGFFSTAPGINAGLTSAYAYLKFYYATQGGMNMQVWGTDEFTTGGGDASNPLGIYSSITTANGDFQALWNRAYVAINTCNGVIEVGRTSTDLSETQKVALLAEAKFLRAQWYFLLVQTFGRVTLDLGAGPLKFNRTPSQFSSRSSLDDCYRAIITDLRQASAELSDRPSAQGRVFKGSALHVLAKAYLTRGWSDVAVTTDYDSARYFADQLITNRATYGVQLLPDYATVFNQGNEYNAEVLFSVNWIDNTTFNDVTPNGLGGDPGNYQNKSNFLFRPTYYDGAPGLRRSVLYGRPFFRYRPTAWLINTAYADKVNDARYYKAFQIVWNANATATTAGAATDANPQPNINVPVWTAAEVTAGARDQRGQLAVAGQPKILLGDTAQYMVPNHLVAKYTPAKITTLSYKDGIYFPGSPPTGGKNYFTDLAHYPSLSKYNATQARANNSTDISSVRPFIVYRFSETYLIAAEAAFMQGDQGGAVGYINVVRTRAAANAGAVANMTANTATGLATGGIDYILDERARELAGEQMRWFDLVRTKKLLTRVPLHNAQAAAGLQAPDAAKHWLRPIPQPQIDQAVDPTSDNGLFPQNPLY